MTLMKMAAIAVSMMILYAFVSPYAFHIRNMARVLDSLVK